MPTRPQIRISKEELDNSAITYNHILVRMPYTHEGVRSKAGVVMGFNLDTTYADKTDSHTANLAEVWGEVYRVPERLFYDPDDPKTMDWDTDMELQTGDLVWFDIMESKNSSEIICDGEIYKSIPYQHCYVARRDVALERNMNAPLHYDIIADVIPLNGYVLCQPIVQEKLSDYDFLSEQKVDKTKAIIKFIGEPPKAYIRDEYSHIEDLQVGDEVLLDKDIPMIYLERRKELATFDGDNLYWVVPRRRIAMVLNRKGETLKSRGEHQSNNIKK